MTRFQAAILCAAFLCAIAPAQETAKDGQHKAAPKQEEQNPPEEDVTAVPAEKVYAFNPIQAEKELKIGSYYFKKGSYKAAAIRFREATKWNPGSAEAYLRLGDAEEKRRDGSAARQAYAKFLELAPEDKRAEAVRKKVGAKD